MTPTFRCSSLDRDLNCNGAITLVPLVNPRKGPEGDEGTYLHYIAHERMKAELGAVGELGPKPDAPKSASFSQWIADYYFEAVRETVQADWSIEVEAAMAYEFTYGVLPYAGTMTFILSGHIDCLAMSPDGSEAIGFDLKTGYDPVDIAEYNWQILGYIVLLMQAYPDLKRVTFFIVQPRNDEDEGFERMSHVTVEATPEVTNGLVTRISAAMANSLELNTGRTQCKWCPASVQCPALQADRDLMKMLLTQEAIARIKKEPDDATLGDWVIAGRTLARPIEDAETLAKERIKANGYLDAKGGTRITIKEQGGSYSFPDPVGFYRATRQLLADDADYAATVKPSVTKTKEALAKVMGLPKTSKKGDSAQSVFDGALRPLCEQGKREVLVFQ